MKKVLTQVRRRKTSDQVLHFDNIKQMDIFPENES